MVSMWDDQKRKGLVVLVGDSGRLTKPFPTGDCVFMLYIKRGAHGGAPLQQFVRNVALFGGGLWGAGFEGVDN